MAPHRSPSSASLALIGLLAFLTVDVASSTAWTCSWCVSW